MFAWRLRRYRLNRACVVGVLVLTGVGSYGGSSADLMSYYLLPTITIQWLVSPVGITYYMDTTGDISRVAGRGGNNG